MELSKLEIQQMLREMNIKFEAEESYESLKKRLQQGNHSLWLKSVSGQRMKDGKKDKIVVRKRKKDDSSGEIKSDQEKIKSPVMTRKSEEPEYQPTSSSYLKNEPAHRSSRIDKPLPGKPWKDVADGTEPFNRKKRVFESVLRRAGDHCELCGVKPDSCSESDSLHPYHLLPLNRGGEHSIKNVVALCSDCLAATIDNPDSKVNKVLKRKTRAKIYESIKVERKKTARSRRRSHHHRK